MSKTQSVLPPRGGSYFKRIFMFSLPLMVTSLLQVTYHAADLMVVGRFDGENALAAVGSTGALTGVIINLFIGLSVGAGVCVAHGVGAKNRVEVKRAVHTSMLLATMLGVVVGVLSFIFAPQLLTLMDTPVDVIEPASLYVRIIFLGTPMSSLSNYSASILRSAGDSKRPLICYTVSGLVNVIFNVIFVVIFKLGVVGVALSTIISQTLSAIMMIVYMMKSDGIVHFSFKHLKIHKKTLKKLLKIGIPSGIQMSLFSFSNVILQTSINSFGAAVIAGSSASANIEGMFSVVYSALGTSAVTFVGQAVGANRKDEVKKIIFTSVRIILVLAVFLVPVAFFLRKPLLSLYVSDGGPVLDAALERFIVMLLPTVLCGIVDLGSGALRGLCKSMHATIISLLCVFLFRWLWMITVYPLVETVLFVYLATVVSRILNAIFNYVTLYVIMQKEKRQKLLTQVTCEVNDGEIKE